MKFKVKEWERKFYPDSNNYKDLFHDIGIFNVHLSKANSQSEYIAIFEKAGKKRYIYGIFTIEIKEKFILLCGFDRDINPIKYVQYQCYNLSKTKRL